MPKKKHEPLSLDPFDRLELVIEERRANAARALAQVLKDKLRESGYLVETDINNSLFDFLESELYPTTSGD